MTHSSVYAIGLMSGTSADGVSGVLAKFHDRSFEIVNQTHHAYPADIKETIHKNGYMTVQDMSKLNFRIGEEFAHTASRLIKKSGVNPEKITCVGSHGQTIYHGPRDKPANTCQIGEPAVIAERTGVPVVSNFRQSDIAAGGEGAPLIPFFDHYFFGHGPVRAFQNIGGISNVTVVGKGVSVPFAFDQGPGNCLMDAAARFGTNGEEHFDYHGQRAKSGQFDMTQLHEMMKDPYLSLKPPKSTGPEHFNSEFLNRYFRDKYITHLNDVLATLNQFTCFSIQESFRDFIFKKYPVEEVVVSGGGAFNKTLMKKLECLFAPIPVYSIDKMNIPPLAKEPLAFAFYGVRRMAKKINHIPQCTGAKRALSLGQVTRP